MTRARFRFSRGLRRCANVRACILAQPRRAGCIIWSMRLWTTPSTRRWPATARTLRCAFCRATSSRLQTTDAAFPPASTPKWAFPRWKWCSQCCMPAESSAARAMPFREASTGWVRRWSMRCPSGWLRRCAKTGSCTPCAFTGACPTAPWKLSPTRARPVPPSPSRPTPRFLTR